MRVRAVYKREEKHNKPNAHGTYLHATGLALLHIKLANKMQEKNRGMMNMK